MENFISHKIKEDLATNKVEKIKVRFPPEPNGYLHLGHVKSILLNSELAREFAGELNLRFDDTNPEKEDDEYVNAIKEDAFWLVDNFNKVLWSSDYFDTMYECALLLIKKGLAYVDDSDSETIRNMRGDFTKKGVTSAFRSRSIDENLELFENMKNGLYANGEKVLRAKIDIEHPNLNMRDPVLYRIRHVEHHNTGNKWCIYPMYDFAHPIEDGIEGITHSICTMEFEDHRPFYDWVVAHCRELLNSTPEQIEFARLEIEGVMLSKRKLLNLVAEKYVSGWSDPSMPTIAGLRRRGFTPAILKDFILKCGVSKANSVIEKHVLDESVRHILNPVAPRTMAIIDPVEMVFTNFREDEMFTVPLHPKDKEMGERSVSFSSSVYVERDDIRLTAEEDFWRIYPENWVRLKHAYNVLIKEIITDENNNPIKVIAEIDYDSKNPKMAKVKAKAALHWLGSSEAKEMDINFYNNLCDEEGNYNPAALVVKTGKVSNYITSDEGHYEFERNGYFYVKNGLAHCLANLKK